MADRGTALDNIASLAQSMPGLELLMRYGSRARGDEHPQSDWDFGFIADARFDASSLLAALTSVLGTDRLDLADLERASGLLRFHAARDGIVVFEARAGVGDRFRLEAAQFWSDVAPVLRRGYEDVLARLDR